MGGLKRQLLNMRAAAYRVKQVVAVLMANAAVPSNLASCQQISAIHSWLADVPEIAPFPGRI